MTFKILVFGGEIVTTYRINRSPANNKNKTNIIIMNKNNVTLKEIEKLLAYCDARFKTRKVSVIKCLDAFAREATGEVAGASVAAVGDLHAVV